MGHEEKFVAENFACKEENTLSNPDYCNHGYYLNPETKDDLTSGNKPKGNKEFEALTNLKG